MRNLITKFFALGLLYFSGFPSLLAQSHAPMTAIARFQGDSVILRWASPEIEVWLKGISKGYTIEKAILAQGKPRFTKVAQTKAVDIQTLLKLYQTNENRNIAIALATLYGETKADLNNSSLKDLQIKSDLLSLRYGYNLLMSDLYAEVATLSGLRYVDKSLPKNSQISYRIFPTANAQMGDTAWVLVDTKESDTLPKVPKPFAEGDERKVRLKWSIPQGLFSAWHIEKSYAGKNQFVRITHFPFQFSDPRQQSKPFLSIEYSDTGLTNYEAFEYKLIGITSFGEECMADSTVIGMGKDKTPPLAPFLEVVKAETNHVNLSWTMNSKGKDLKNYLVLRSENAEGPFFAVSPLLESENLSYRDTTPADPGGTYYKVLAIDTAGNAAESNEAQTFLRDSIPPDIPLWIGGKADSSGIVHLNWHPSTAKDVLSYRLYRAYAADHAFALVSPLPITDTFYHDTVTVRSLTHKVYYRLAAEDPSQNISKMGPELYVKRPDFIPPIPPIIRTLRESEGSIWVNVQPSPDEDVEVNWVSYRKEGEKEWKMAGKVNLEKLAAGLKLDSLPFNQRLELRAFARDSSGNQSEPSDPIFYKTPDNPESYIRDFTIKLEGNSVLLSWIPGEDIEFISILKAEGTGKMLTLASLDGKEVKFSDNQVSKGKTYSYALRIVKREGEKFTLNQKISIPEN